MKGLSPLYILGFAVLKGLASASPQALQKDDECLAGENCALNALQLRSEDPEVDTNFTDLDHINPDDQELLCDFRFFSWVCCMFPSLVRLCDEINTQGTNLSRGSS